MANSAEALAAWTDQMQEAVESGRLTYNQAVARLYGDDPAWQETAARQVATLTQLETQQRTNETAAHRMVGLVIETRPDTVSAQRLMLIRRLGCTKVQMGVQSLDEAVLRANHRSISPSQIADAFALARLFGFKIHAHFMANLLGSSPEADKADYLRFVTEEAYQPDEIKLYPCALIAGSQLVEQYETGKWRPYTEEELLDVLAADVLATPPFIRVSRMIRDFSAGDIAAGNKKGNLRQAVDRRVERICSATEAQVREIRTREIGTGSVKRDALIMTCHPYRTTVTSERFLEWVAPDGKIAGFLRLSLPDAAFVSAHADELPVEPGDAMIREVHVYGKVAGLGDAGHAAQHTGLGRALVERACEMASLAGYRRINVISSIGTREYYRRLGFADNGLYQQRQL